ncbi:hypothetical protein GCM10010215_35790 [Streptomyces virginiae]|uniref:Uncharacterized protein n=1 Tax=Streptomyces virginiae TaxID=1961 RepID=A0ABQ3NPP1_STRVG|nr:hypothetical protein GCM10010215_35790 [Streptomyces virginiae]GHI14757.1 hypothetical protein Scinn_42200 [Streptomyces virginiae]
MDACSRQVGSGDGTADRRKAPGWECTAAEGRENYERTEGVRVRSAGSPGSWVQTGAMRVCSILVDNTEQSAAGILTPGSPRAARLPDRPRQWRVDGSTLPGHSGGTVPDSHRLPCTADLVPRTYSWTS